MGRPPIGDKALTKTERQRRWMQNRVVKAFVQGRLEREREFLMEPKALRPQPAPLPTTSNQLLAMRKLKQERTLNDQIEDIYVSLAEDDKFMALLYAVYHEQAVEGHTKADDYMAAQALKAKAVKMGYHEVAHAKLETIRKCMTVVLRRYGLTRVERRNTIGGRVLPPPPVVVKTDDDGDDNGIDNG